MPVEVSIQARAGYIHVKATGENSPAAVKEYMGRVMQATRAMGCPYVLIEENLTGPGLGTFDVFSLVSEGSREAAPAMLRIGYVDANPEHEPRMMKFMETVATNRGINVRVFATVGEAEAWLSGLSGAARTG